MSGRRRRNECFGDDFFSFFFFLRPWQSRLLIIIITPRGTPIVCTDRTIINVHQFYFNLDLDRGFCSPGRESISLSITVACDLS